MTLGYNQKDHPYIQRAQNKGKKAALWESSVIYQQIVPMEIFTGQCKRISASLVKDIR